MSWGLGFQHERFGEQSSTYRSLSVACSGSGSAHHPALSQTQRARLGLSDTKLQKPGFGTERGEADTHSLEPFLLHPPQGSHRGTQDAQEESLMSGFTTEEYKNGKQTSR